MTESGGMGEADSGTDWFHCRRDGQGQLLPEGGDLRGEQCWGGEVGVEGKPGC